MNQTKRMIYCLFILSILGITFLNPAIVRAAASPAASIAEAKTAIEKAARAGAEKTAPDDLLQAKSWLANAEKEYERSQSLLSRSMKLVMSSAAQNEEIRYLATMAKIKGQIAEAKAGKITVTADLKNAQKDLADYQTTLDVINRKLAEAEQAQKVKIQAETKQRELEQAKQKALREESQKLKELEEAQKKVKDLEALKQKELAEANLKGQQLASQKAKEEAELRSLRQKMAVLDKTKAMLADAVKISNVTVKSIEKEILIDIAANKIFSSKNEIHTKGRSILDDVAAYLKKYATSTATIRGYTDNTGKAETNRILTEKRAQKVKEYLVNFHAIAPARMVAKGFGSAQPVAPNSTAAGRASNRRIEIGVAID